jgi:hypothetical protein
MPPAPSLSQPTISHQQMRDALLRSGYLLEYRVEQVFRAHGYFVEANQAYPDPITGKSRELDLAAMSGKLVWENETSLVFSRPLVECVNNTQPMAFITKSSIVSGAHVYDLPFSGLPLKVNSNGRWVPLAVFLGMDKYHHHCEGLVATQYC